MASVKLVQVTEAHQAAMSLDETCPDALDGLRVPAGWPLYRDVFGLPVIADWPFFLFVDPDAPAVLGSGGFLGPPDARGFVQVGYEVAPGFRGRGIATAAMRQVLQARPTANVVAAVSAANTPSIRVLEKLGFRTSGQSVAGPDGAPLALWHLVRANA